MKFLAPAILTLLALVATPVSADSVVRSGESVSISADQTVEGDFYAAASVVSISGVITEDLIAAGGKVTVNGSIANDVLILAGAADLHGEVAEDVRIIAGETIIAEPIAGDVLVLGGTLEVLSTATIAGDILFFGGEATIAGSVGGDVLGYAGTMRIDAPVGGNVSVTTESLTLGDRANIAGNLAYTSAMEMVRSQNATIAGTDTHTMPKVQAPNTAIRSTFLPVLALLFAALVWFLIGRRSLSRVTNAVTRNTLRELFVGFAVLLGTPFFAGILIMSMIGVIPGIVLFLLYVTAVFLALAASIAVCGQYVQLVIRSKDRSLSALTLGIGAVCIWIALLIPVVGPIVFLTLFVISLGAVAESLYKAARS